MDPVVSATDRPRSIATGTDAAGDAGSHTPLPPAGPLKEVVIRPPGAFAHIDLRELWQFRGVLLRKVKQRIRVTYDNMWLGFVWAVARPVLMVFVFWAFRGLADVKTAVTIPYPLYVYAGLVFWFSLRMQHVR